jgi:hypothetical protein
MNRCAFPFLADFPIFQINFLKNPENLPPSLCVSVVNCQPIDPLNAHYTAGV